MLISPISLAAMSTIQKHVSTKVRPVGLININTKGQYLCAAIYESGLFNPAVPISAQQSRKNSSQTSRQGSKGFFTLSSQRGKYIANKG